MSDRYIGGIISPIAPVVTTTSAKGIWAEQSVLQNIAAGIWPSVDPYYSYVSLLLHCDGTNGGTTFTDNSQNVFTVTASGAVITTTTPKYGTGAALFTAGQYLSIASNAAFAFTGDFTIELWVRPDAIAQSMFIDRWAGSNQEWILGMNSSGNPVFYWAPYATASPAITGSNTFSTGTYYFVQLVKSGATATLYVAGSSVGTIGGLTAGSDLGNNIRIGAYNGGAGWDYAGRIDDVRVTKGVARPNAVPTAAFPNF